MNGIAAAAFAVVFTALLTVIVAAAMGLITLFVTPGTSTPTLAMHPDVVTGIGVFGAIFAAGLCTVLGSVAIAGGVRA